MNFDKAINKRFRMIRAGYKIKQEDFKVLCGMSQPVVAKIENEQRPLNVNELQKLSILGINANWLLTGQGDMELSNAK
jgi:transcriptional regulator with XRE-family HTH domain